MGYRSLEQCLFDLEKHGHLVRIREEVDPDLEMAAIQLRVFENGGPALLFERVKGTPFRCVSNLFGTMERSRFIFRSSLQTVKRLMRLKGDPSLLIKNPSWLLGSAAGAWKALPRRSSAQFEEISLRNLPQIRSWPDDGGPFITLPQVYSEDPERPGISSSNLGMYRIQLSGNDYEKGEVGLHYQIHRGIGVHQSRSNRNGKPLKVSVFVGGPPAHTVAAVMPIPEGISEINFAGVLGNRKFRYSIDNGNVVSSDADFVLIGEIRPHDNRPEGPFGDHLGYYSLKHEYPVLHVRKVLAKKNAIWPFTVVGRPPQEDTVFGALIHELTSELVPEVIPGLHEVNAVDAAGVHPLLLAVGSERYTPFNDPRRPQELLTIANAILGFGQMSLAKFLFIIAKEDDQCPSVNDPESFFGHVLERMDMSRDLHFQTRTTMDTLDYSGPGLNSGSKLVLAATGEIKRELCREVPDIEWPTGFSDPRLVMPGVVAVRGPRYADADDMTVLSAWLEQRKDELKELPLIVVVDDSDLVASSMSNFLWVTFTRNDPACDVHGAEAFVEHKHWGCRGPLIFDSRIKPHHAPPLIKNPKIEKRVDRLGASGASLHGII